MFNSLCSWKLFSPQFAFLQVRIVLSSTVALRDLLKDSFVFLCAILQGLVGRGHTGQRHLPGLWGNKWELPSSSHAELQQTWWRPSLSSLSPSSDIRPFLHELRLRWTDTQTSTFLLPGLLKPLTPRESALSCGKDSSIYFHSALFSVFRTHQILFSLLCCFLSQSLASHRLILASVTDFFSCLFFLRSD